MGTEVLRPENLLVERFHAPPTPFHRRRNFHGNFNNLTVNRRPNNNRKTSPKPDKKKFSDNAATKKVTHGGDGDARRKEGGGGGGLAVGQVTILRRGESLDSLTAKINGGNPNLKSSPKKKPVDDLAVLGTGRIGPDSPKMVPKQIRLSPPPPSGHVYAGSAFSLSPSPQSLPLPSFFNKKQQDSSNINSFDDPATRVLRQLLRLD